MKIRHKKPDVVTIRLNYGNPANNLSHKASMDARSLMVAEERFFSTASRCGYHTRVITILQGDDGDLFAVCEKDLKEPLEDMRRWVGRGNDTLRELVSALLCGATPYNLNVILTVPFRPLRASEEDHLG